MKILLVTSRLAKRIVEEAVQRAKARGLRHDVDVLVLPVEVAAILSTDQLLYLLLSTYGRERLRCYDIIIIPGLVRGSAKLIEEQIGVRVVKGFIHATMIDELLMMKDEDLLSLSSEVPADEVLAKRTLEDATEKLRLLESVYREDGSCVDVGGVCIPRYPPPIRIVAVVPLSMFKLCGDLVERIRNADIIGLAVDTEADSSEVLQLFRSIEREISKPLAVDAYSPKLVHELSQHIDFVLNAYPKTLESIPKERRREIGVSVIPLDPSRDLYPRGVDEKLRFGISIVECARSLGYEKIVLDLVLEAPLRGLAESILAYIQARKILDIPLQMNLSNVVEFMDADSHGIVALLVSLAQELGVSVVSVYEMDGRSYGVVKEAVIAQSMVSIAALKRVPPRDIGIDLLVVKEPRYIDIEIVGDRKPLVVDVERSANKAEIDPQGLFKIRVDRSSKRIELLYIGRKGVILLRGRDPWSLIYEVIDRGLVSKPQHLAYLGYELAKAEIALKLGKSYVQDAPVVKSVDERLIRIDC